MKFSLQWLSRYVDLSDVDVSALADRFTLSVAELEGFEEVGSELDSVIVARIDRCEPHPNADRLRVCSVNDGSDTLRTVVCGAPNARVGLVTALALPGSNFNGFKIRAAQVRGVESAGMLCAPDELGLGDRSEGIWELPSSLPIGAPLHEVMPVRDTLFEVDNKSITHRPDLWGHYGIAREVAGLLGRPLKPLEAQIDLGSAPAPSIEIQDEEACPRYCALRMQGLTVAPSPLWMQLLLYRCETRAINNIVDVTNFVMMELGQPLHAFDAREIKGDRLIVRHAIDGEEVITLDGQGRDLISSDLLICDGERPVALAGVMGLENSEVKDDTSELVLEAANFASGVVRRTAVRLGLRTEASARFEKSLDPSYPELAALRFAYLLKEICPTAEMTTVMGDVWPNPPAQIMIETSVGEINRRLGTTIPADQVRAYLRSVAFDVKELDEDRMVVKVPSFRATKDVSIPADLVEEVGRLYGYDHITPTQPTAEIAKPYRHPMRTLQRKIRTILSGQVGCYEIRNYTFDSEPLLERIGRASTRAVELKNPLSREQRFLRTSLIPQMLGALERSIAHTNQLKVYEIGRVFKELNDDQITDAHQLPDQPFMLTGLVWRRSAEGAPSSSLSAHLSEEDRSFFELKGMVEHLARQLNLQLRFIPSDGGQPAWMHPKRCALLETSGGIACGYIGGLHPDVSLAMSLGKYASLYEVSLDILNGLSLSYGGYEQIARYPAISYDLSVIIPEEVSYAQLAQMTMQAHRSWVRDVQCVSIYRGEPIPDGQKSVTLQIRFQDPNGTLEMEGVNKVVEKLVSRMGKELGGWIR